MKIPFLLLLYLCLIVFFFVIVNIPSIYQTEKRLRSERIHEHGGFFLLRSILPTIVNHSIITSIKVVEVEGFCPLCFRVIAIASVNFFFFLILKTFVLFTNPFYCVYFCRESFFSEEAFFVSLPYIILKIKKVIPAKSSIHTKESNVSLASSNFFCSSSAFTSSSFFFL